mmetsp:Transcript_36093/g.114744  ORF Transcript_36093/g.114744 Transcript_36093/m.114744 type:complete len:288 (+) Transcript_36093:59-922(+)
MPCQDQRSVLHEPGTTGPQPAACAGSLPRRQAGPQHHEVHSQQEPHQLQGMRGSIRAQDCDLISSTTHMLTGPPRQQAYILPLPLPLPSLPSLPSLPFPLPVLVPSLFFPFALPSPLPLSFPLLSPGPLPPPFDLPSPFPFPSRSLLPPFALPSLPLPSPLKGEGPGGEPSSSKGSLACGRPSLLGSQTKVMSVPTLKSPSCALWMKTSRPKRSYIAGQSTKPKPWFGLKDFIRPTQRPGGGITGGQPGPCRAGPARPRGCGAMAIGGPPVLGCGGNPPAGTGSGMP